MAPEQAKGKPVDRRADIWAFGVVLYEMLAGKRGYEAEDVSDTLAAVLMRDVDWNALPASVPPRLRALLSDCLVRDPKQRLRDIGDARRVLDQIISGTPEPLPATASAASSSRLGTWGVLGWVVATLALAAGAALAFVHFREAPPARQRTQFLVSPPAKLSIASFALSPDGRYVAFAYRAFRGPALAIRTTCGSARSIRLTRACCQELKEWRLRQTNCSGPQTATSSGSSPRAG